jgi:hypothetical protein
VSSPQTALFHVLSGILPASYGNLDHPGRRVITCRGAFDHRARSFVDNSVVSADQVAVGSG